MSGIIKASFLRLMLRPTALCLDVCNRHIIYLGWDQGELLCGISNPSSRSKFPKVNQVSLQIQHKNCSFPNCSTRAAHAGKHPRTWLQKTARSDIPQAVFFFFGGGGQRVSSLLRMCCDEAKINPFVDSFSLCSQSHQKQMIHLPWVLVQTCLVRFCIHHLSFLTRRHLRVQELICHGDAERKLFCKEIYSLFDPEGCRHCALCRCMSHFSAPPPPHLFFIEHWIKDWQDLALHQSRIFTSGV